ncbi:MAG TPA: fluoride efflux transporter CrcB [Vicinamibacteria bacterium]|nr:fluoride efflux transporter CrcB [Vicinamibacteria bacterium]
MSRFFLVCIGGAIGTGIRYLVAITAPRLFGTAFPYGTLAVNVVGSFLLGAILHLGLATTLISPTMKLVLASGIMGGLTTYSTFNYETLEYVSQGAFWLAGLNVVATVTLCLLAGALGVTSARWLLGS